jgi:hypothetical protein
MLLTVHLNCVLRILLLGFLFLCHSVSSAQGDTSCTLSLLDTIRIDQDTSLSVVPQVVDQGDTIQVVWFNNYTTPTEESNLGIFHSRSLDGGITYSIPAQVLSYDSANGNPGLLAASGRYLYLTHLIRLDTFPWSSLGIHRSTDGGTSWSEVSTFGHDYTPRAITAHDSSVYLRFDYLDSTGGVNRLYSGCASSHNYGQAFDVVALNLPPFGGDGSVGVGTLTLSDRVLHYVYGRPATIGSSSIYEVFYTRSEDRGVSWTIPTTISVVDSISSLWPRISGDDLGKLYVVWYDFRFGSVDQYHGTILTRRSRDNGISWESEEIISDAGVALNPRISVFGKIVQVAWDNYVSDVTDMTLTRFSDDSATTWQEQIPVNGVGTSVDLSQGRGSSCIAWREGGAILVRRGEFLGGCLPPELPVTFKLDQNFPNPTNSTTRIGFSLPAGEFLVNLTVFNVLGQVIARLLNGIEQGPGEHSVEWSTVSVPSGVYFYELRTDGFVATRKMVVVR